MLVMGKYKDAVRNIQASLYLTPDEKTLLQAAVRKANCRSMPEFIVAHINKTGLAAPAVIKSSGTRKMIGMKLTQDEHQEALRRQEEGFFGNFGDMVVAMAARVIGGKEKARFIIETK